jgi:hypothetical protein
VNKNPDTPITFTLTNMPRGSYFLRHFGGEAGVFKWQVRTEPFLVRTDPFILSTDDGHYLFDRLYCCSCLHCRFPETKLMGGWVHSFVFGSGFGKEKYELT